MSLPSVMPRPPTNSTTTAAVAAAAATGNETSQQQENGGKKKDKGTGYMNKPPLIMPNYGKKKSSMLPKSNVPRVLLYDNVTQQQMLDVKLAHIKIEQQRQGRLMDLHKRSFMTRQQKRQQQLKETYSSNYSSKTSSKNSNSNSNTVNSNSNNETAINRQNSDLQGDADALETIAQENEVKPDSPKNENPQNTAATPINIDRLPSAISGFSVNMDDLKIAEIDEDGHKRHVIFKLQDAAGLTHVYHTYDDEGIFSEFIPLHEFYPKTTDDPRFQGLVEVLVRTQHKTDGYAELSPSYRKEYPKLPGHLVKDLPEPPETSPVEDEHVEISESPDVYS